MDPGRVENDRGPDVAGHHHRRPQMRGVDPKVGEQCLGKPSHGELGRAVGGVRVGRAERRPQAVDAARVDDVTFVGDQQHRQEDAGAVVDATPIDAEGPVPIGAVVDDEAAATPDAGVVEQEVDVLGSELGRDRLAEGDQCRLVGDVGHKSHHPDTRRGLAQGQRPGLCHVGGGQVTGGDVTSFAGELAHQFSADARTAAGDHGDPPLESLHPGTPVRRAPRTLGQPGTAVLARPPPRSTASSVWSKGGSAA